MKKFILLAGIFLLCACSLMGRGTVLSDSQSQPKTYVRASEKAPVKVTYAQTQETAPKQATAQPVKAQPVIAQPAMAQRSTGVSVKARGENFVTYEYKDIRVDQLRGWAESYCKQKGYENFALRDIIVYRNYMRRATFDCFHLANEK